MPAKKAVLIGCNYPGTSAELKGCINDVLAVKDMLISCFGFTLADITIMIDTDKSTTQPTGKNIKAALRAMIDASGDDDQLVVHFSGHGTQVPTADPKEVDGKDEAICPCDMNVMTDNDLRAIFMPLKDKKNVKLTFIADCCHSGTLLDHDEVVITGPKAGGPPPPNVDVQAIQNMLSMLGGGKKEMDGQLLKNRALPFSDLSGLVMDMMAKLMGGSAGKEGAAAAPGGMGQNDFHSAMASLFGKDASANTSQHAQLMQMVTMGASLLGFGGAAAGTAGAAGTASPGGAAAPVGGAPEPSGGSMLAGLFSMCFGGDAAAQSSASQTYAAPAEGGQQQQQSTGHKPNSEELPLDVGILITGCQDKETSADARPPGGNAHGALTNALVTVVKSHVASGATYPLTYRNLVIGVRETLAKSGFAQNPCLECGGKWADSQFVVHSA